MITEREMAIALIDNDCPKRSDAIILLEGDGFNRYQKAVELFKEGQAEKIIFSGGIIDYDYGSFPYSDILPLVLKAGVPEKCIIHENKSKNTREQALEVINIALQQGWKKLLLVATHYHQYRAYLTFLRVLLDEYPSLILYNSPARNLDWFAETGWGIRLELLKGEFDRIEKYSILGHLATFKEAIEYQRWKETQR